MQLVAYHPDNPLEMDKMWSLMSELDKDELIHKEHLFVGAESAETWFLAVFFLFTHFFLSNGHGWIILM